MPDVKYSFACGDSDLRQIIKSAKIFWGGLSENFFFFYCLRRMKCFELTENSDLKETRPRYDQKFVYSDIRSQNNWNKVKKDSKTEKGYRTVITKFACFLQLLSAFNSCKKHWVLSCVSTHIWHFSNISYFLTILSLKSFRKS